MPHVCSVVLHSDAVRQDSQTVWSGTARDTIVTVAVQDGRRVQLAPSPISRSFSIGLSLDLESIPRSIALVSIEGREVYRAQPNTSLLTIPVSVMPSIGWYAVEIEWQGARQRIPILVVE